MNAIKRMERMIEAERNPRKRAEMRRELKILLNRLEVNP